MIRRPPDDVRAVPDRGERVLAWGRDRAGRPVVASEAALYLPRDGVDPERLPYSGIARATWSDPVLDVVLATTEDGRRRVDLEIPGEVPPTVRERVMASIVVSRRVDLVAGGAALISARRVAGSDRLAWSVSFDAGLDPSDPELRAAADAAITAIRAETGL